MFSRKSFVSSCLLLAGCSSLPGQWPAWFPKEPASSAVIGGARGAPYSAFNFDWEVEGDPHVMPLQVFDDGARVWLQFTPEGAWPAVFEAAPAGWRALAYRREGPYMVLDGVFDRLVLRGGHLQAHVQRVGRAVEAAGAAPHAAQAHAVALPALRSAESDAEQPPAAGATGVRAVPAEAARPAPGQTEPEGTTVARNPQQSRLAPEETIAENAAEPSGQGAMVFSLGPADLTIRQALQRWAGSAGWTFSPEHWSVDVDIPLVGHASFIADFRSAVREMLAATEMGDRPVQPCFYSNRVLRVVPLSQSCDRRQAMGAVS